ncbi:MAG TPA: hypothetical protein PK159_12225, partial [Steroidobacteraceae bacterium]|nr:hypothetical protein [Steroidobacteraceae bacterium]
HPGWQGGSALPVVERGDRLLGVLTRDALIRALARARRLARDDDAAETLVSVLAGSYWQSLSGIIETLTATLPTIRPVAGERSEH